MRLVRTILLTTALMAASTPVVEAATPARASTAAAAPAYAGTWSVDPAQCKVPQEQQGAPMVLKRTRLDQHEAHCTFKSLRRAGKAAWWVSAECLVEGSKQRDRFTLRIKGDTLVMARGKAAQTYKRCK